MFGNLASWNKCTETKLVDGDGVFVDYEENGTEKDVST